MRELKDMQSASRSVGQALTQLLFAPPAPGGSGRLATLGALALLYLAGVGHWLFFFCTSAKSFSFHVIRFSTYQWTREFVFLSTLQEAVRGRVVPYHLTEPLKGTDRFLAIPDYVLSPQILLLGWTDVATFVLVNTILLYSCCFLGCMMLRQRYRLSLFAFTLLLLLVGFNGNLTAQLGAGHYVWAGFFLLPIFCLLVLELVEDSHSHTLPVRLTLVLGAMMFQGTYHFYSWGALFLLLFWLFSPPHRPPIARALLLSVPLVALRLVPALLTFGGSERAFLSGYPTLETLLAGLAVIRTHDTEPLGVLANLFWWEYDVYLSLIGVAVVGYFGLYLRVKERPDLAHFRFQPLDLPMLVMSLFSLSLFYAPIASLPLPLLSSERVSSRFLLVPLLLLIVIATLRLNVLLPQLVARPIPRLLALAGLAQLAFSLLMHSSLWRVSVLEAEAPLAVNLAQLDATFSLTTRPDPLYTTLVTLSFFVSLGTLAALLGAWAWLARRPVPPGRET